VVAAYHLSKLGLPQGLEAGVLIAVTFGGCWAAYEVARRLGSLGLVLGVKLAPRSRPVRLETREQQPVGQDG
jgi:hypothetical protein